MMAAVDKKIVGAWYEPGKTGLTVVYFTQLGTAHAGDLRKSWRVPQDARADMPIAEHVDAKAPGTILALRPPLHPLLSCDDKELAEAFERLVGEPAFAKIGLTDWEFKLAADAPSVFLKWGRFTWKQRKYLREIAKKIVGAL